MRGRRWILAVACAPLLLACGDAEDALLSTERDGNGARGDGDGDGDGPGDGRPSGRPGTPPGSEIPGSSSGNGDGGNGGKDGSPKEDAAPPPPWSPAGCASQPNVLGFTNRTAGGGQYVAYAPPSYSSAAPRRLVVALHGAGDRAQNYLSILWKANADAQGFVVLAPEGSLAAGSGTTWANVDAPKILAAIDDLEKCYRIDAKKRIVNGFSAGGRMAFFVALKNANRFSGIAVAGSAFLANDALYQLQSPLPAAWKIPVSHFHGSADANFPLALAQQGKGQLEAAGHSYSLHVLQGVGHTTSPANAATMFAELAASSAP